MYNVKTLNPDEIRPEWVRNKGKPTAWAKDSRIFNLVWHAEGGSKGVNFHLRTPRIKFWPASESKAEGGAGLDKWTMRMQFPLAGDATPETDALLKAMQDIEQRCLDFVADYSTECFGTVMSAAEIRKYKYPFPMFRHKYIKDTKTPDKTAPPSVGLRFTRRKVRNSEAKRWTTEVYDSSTKCIFSDEDGKTSETPMQFFMEPDRMSYQCRAVISPAVWVTASSVAITWDIVQIGLFPDDDEEQGGGRVKGCCLVTESEKAAIVARSSAAAASSASSSAVAAAAAASGYATDEDDDEDFVLPPASSAKKRPLTPPPSPVASPVAPVAAKKRPLTPPPSPVASAPAAAADDDEEEPLIPVAAAPAATDAAKKPRKIFGGAKKAKPSL